MKQDVTPKYSDLKTGELDTLLEGMEAEFPTLPEYNPPDLDDGTQTRKTRRTFIREQIASLGDIELEVRIELGHTTMLLSEAAQLRPGSVVILDKHVNELVNILVNGKAVARGELIIVDGCFSVRIAEFL